MTTCTNMGSLGPLRRCSSVLEFCESSSDSECQPDAASCKAVRVTDKRICAEESFILSKAAYSFVRIPLSDVSGLFDAASYTSRQARVQSRRAVLYARAYLKRIIFKQQFPD